MCSAERPGAAAGTVDAQNCIWDGLAAEEKSFEPKCIWVEGWRTQCFKIVEKVSFYKIASEASYVYILSRQKFMENAKNG